MVQEQPICEHEERVWTLPDDCRECVVDLFPVAHSQRQHFYSQHLGCSHLSLLITCIGLAAFQSTAMCETLGTTSLSSSKRFPSISTDIEVNPVTLPPCRARLATRPVATGPPTATMTRGHVWGA